MLNVCKALFEEWNHTGVRYCHWKSNEHLMAGLDGDTDLDVFVLLDDRETAQQILEKNLYIKFRPQKCARYPLVDEWIGFDYDTGKLVHVHLHYQIITGTKYNKEYVFPIDQMIIETRVQDGETGVYITSPELELIILYSRIALKAKNKKSIQPKKDDVREITYLRERVEWHKQKEVCAILLGKYSDALFALLEPEQLSVEQWHRVFLLVRKWLAPYRKHSALYAKLKYKYHRYRNILISVLNSKLRKNCITRKTLPEKGLSVCFIGADGSGKSTVSQEIMRWLNWKVEAKRFYLGSGDHYNSIAKRLLKKFSSKKAQATKDALHQPKPDADRSHKDAVKKEKIGLKRRLMRYGHKILSSIYLKQIAVRSYRELKRAQKYVKKGAIALYDRFPQNQFEGMYDGPKIAVRANGRKGILVSILAHSEERAIRKAQKYQPTLMFKLLLPAEESVRRKPDHTMEEVAPKAAITAQLVFEKSHVFDIDATQPYELELLEIKRMIWKELTNK